MTRAISHQLIISKEAPKTKAPKHAAYAKTMKQKPDPTTHACIYQNSRPSNSPEGITTDRGQNGLLQEPTCKGKLSNHTPIIS